MQIRTGTKLRVMALPEPTCYKLPRGITIGSTVTVSVYQDNCNCVQLAEADGWQWYNMTMFKLAHNKPATRRSSTRR